MKKIYIFLANGFEEIEAISTIDVLRRANLSTITCSIETQKEVSGAHGIIVTADILFNENDFSDADMLVLPGGMPGTNNLNNYAPLKDLIVQHYKSGKAIAAICAAPLVFGGLQLLQNVEATCYPGFEDMLTGAILSDKTVVEDQAIITANGPGSAISFGLKIVDFLIGKEVMEEVAGNIYKTANRS